MTERVSLEGLRYAKAVAETGSFSAAARAFGVSQPALSSGVARLEERLGARLFERSTRGVRMTAFGAQILPLIERTLGDVDALTAEARRLTDPGPRSIRVGVSPLVDPGLVTRAYRAVRELDRPRDLVLREADLAMLQDGLVAGDLDPVLAPSVSPLPRFEHRIIDAEPMVVVTAQAADASSAEGAVRHEPVELTDVAGDPFILVPDACGLTTFTSQLFAAHDLPLTPYPGAASSYRVLEQWAGLGFGAALLPLSKLSSPDAPHRPLLDGGVEVEIFYEAVWDPGSGLAPDLCALADQLAARPDRLGCLERVGQPTRDDAAS
ncbi:DNA-binding transcriptional LysR family regulator [Salana multivorans]|uniref:DNA-binding transcriptional LysR family regulator n=1 Tax=Salana multivorans TaxID=120377 RepID=A0A3N2D927_9MICO|nr:LysR family transcriptional regulator [Salana multivorans]ROR96295.1 DNA-binding transcriptional LysR family regulator [Salana multivorans]